MRLKLVHNLTKSEYIFTGLTDVNSSKLFYGFDITLKDGMSEGEYSYELYDDNEIMVGTGLLQVGDYTPEKEEYKDNTTENKTYIEYQG